MEVGGSAGVGGGGRKGKGDGFDNVLYYKVLPHDKMFLFVNLAFMLISCFSTRSSNPSLKVSSSLVQSLFIFPFCRSPLSLTFLSPFRSEMTLAIILKIFSPQPCLD